MGSTASAELAAAELASDAPSSSSSATASTAAAESSDALNVTATLSTATGPGLEATTAAAPRTAQTGPLACLPPELLLVLVDSLDADAYLALAQTCSCLRRAFRRPLFLKHIVACPSSDKPRSWEQRVSDPLWEQLMLATKLVERASRSPLRSPGLEYKYANAQTMSLSRDGRYVAWQESWLGGYGGNDRIPMQSRWLKCAVWMWDIFANVHFPLPDLLPNDHVSLKLHTEHDLLLVYRSGETVLWGLDDLSAPIFYQELGPNPSVPHVRDTQCSSTCGLADSGKYLIVRIANSNTVSTLQISALQNGDASEACVLSWTGVDAFAFSEATPDVIIAADGRVQHWNVDTRSLVHEEAYAHFPAPPGLLVLSRDGTRAVACPVGSEEQGTVQEVCTWSLNQPSWPLTRFPSLRVCRAGSFGRNLPFALSFHGRFWAYLVTFWAEREEDDDGSDWVEPVDFIILYDLYDSAAPPLALRTEGPYCNSHEEFRAEAYAKLLFLELNRVDSPSELLRPASPGGMPDTTNAREASETLQRLGARQVSFKEPSDATEESSTSPARLRDYLGQCYPEIFAADVAPNERWVALSGRDPVKIVLLPLTAPQRFYYDVLVDPRPSAPPLQDDAGVD